jgi:RNA polymerase I-specific transcription initiation factor RRN7
MYSSQIVCRDIWALYLSTIPWEISPEPLLHKQDGESNQSSSIKRSSKREPAQPEELGGAEDEGADSESIESSSSEEEEDPELDALLEQLSASEDGEPDSSFAPIDPTHSIRRQRGVYELPANNIAVLVLACWTLRIPVIFRDFTK